ncbi:MAG: hypothetical protein ACHQ2Z_04325 [Elusimicrobiota bacterium]
MRSALLALPALTAGFSTVDPAYGGFALGVALAAVKALLVLDYLRDRG